MFGIYLILLAAFYGVTKCTIHKSVADMKNALRLEEVSIKILEEYTQVERRKLEKLNRYLENYKKENNKAVEDMEVYTENTINAYLLVKRLTADWNQVELLMSLNNNKNMQANVAYYKEHSMFPTYEDLNGTIVALAHLQKTYNLDAPSIARGYINGVKYSSELSAFDCFQIGKYCYENNNFNCSHSWLIEADKRNNAVADVDVEKSLILEYMALSAYNLGNIALALNIATRLSNMSPNHPDALRMMNQYKKDIQKGCDTQKTDDELEMHPMYLYRNICREDVTPSTAVLSKLKCRYVNNDNHFLFIAPFKLEEVSLHPRVVLFHDVISYKFIEVLKKLSHDRFEKSQVSNDSANNDIYNAEIGKVTWFEEHENKYLEDLYKRVTDMTGLSVKTAEPLQVLNYGVGGRFMGHYDYDPYPNASLISQRGFGNRIATVLFYMSDVSQGGGTAFLVPKINIRPQKGSAAFWYNVDPNGDGDESTAHGSCPVLVGSKWVANMWLYEYGQEFLRPCEVNRFSRNFPKDI